MYSQTSNTIEIPHALNQNGVPRKASPISSGLEKVYPTPDLQVPWYLKDAAAWAEIQTRLGKDPAQPKGWATSVLMPAEPARGRMRRLYVTG